MSKVKTSLLDTYNKMRDFGKTNEPKGTSTKSSKQPIFVVQKHAATRLHWDFRLELDGVLKSWAVTNEPIPDPAIKRLAVRTEDHPMSYAYFSGDIPKGQYGGGHVDLWDDGTWQPIEDPHDGLKKGKLSFMLSGKRMNGHWNLVRMKQEGKRENWLLIKGRDDDALIAADTPTMEKLPLKKKAVKPIKAEQTVRPSSSPRFGPHTKAKIDFNPVLALRVDDAPEGKDWLHEIKFDGYRALLYLDKGKATIITRGGMDWTDRFRDIAKAAENLKIKSAAIDGEIVVFKENGITDFGLLQQTLAGEVSKPMVFMAFDLLIQDGKDLKKLPLLERKTALQKILPAKTKSIQYSDHVIGGGKAFFKQAGKMKVEGIISKNAASPYRPGRGGDWLKVKLAQTEEFIIGGILPRSDNAKRVGAVLLGYFKDGAFYHVGKSGTGFPEAVSDQIMAGVKRLKIDKSPFTAGSKPKGRWNKKDVIWVKPEMVGVIEYTERTSDDHVRHAVFKGLREDKAAKDVHLEKVKDVKIVTKKSVEKAPKTAMRTLQADPEFAGVTITHPERVVYPETGQTKGGVAAYYNVVADYMLPFLTKRPLSIIRCPDGLKARCFFQRHLEGKAAEHVTLLPIKDSESGDPYFSADDESALLSLVQYGGIEFHPWGSKGPKFDKPDRLIFDLDPDERIDWDSIKAATLVVKQKLEAIGLRSFLKTTGGKGLHVVVPIQPQYGWDIIKPWTRKFVESIEAEYPKAFVTTASKEKRKGKIYLDYLRNDETSTAVAPFSLRTRPGATVSMPLEWKDLKKLASPAFFTIENVPKILGKNYNNPWAEFDSVKQKLPKSY